MVERADCVGSVTAARTTNSGGKVTVTTGTQRRGPFA